jgi:hypothetical protein
MKAMAVIAQPTADGPSGQHSTDSSSASQAAIATWLVA